MDERLFVRIEVPTLCDGSEDGGGTYGTSGTGYPVGEQLILTARHVVAPEHRDDRYPIRVHWVKFPDFGDKGRVTLDRDDRAIVYLGTGEPDDIALLCCPRRPPDLTTPLWPWGPAPEQDDPYSSIGYPKATRLEAPGEAVAAPTQNRFDGKIRITAEPWFEITDLHAPSAAEHWSGASGMPIFVGDRIIGVFSAALEFIDGKGHALPVAPRLTDAAFAAWFQPCGIWERLRGWLAASARSAYTLLEKRSIFIVLALGIGGVGLWLAHTVSAKSFRDCPQCPEMVVVPNGAFFMGAPDTDADSSKFNTPQHEVVFARPFAISKTPISFGQWRACVAENGCDASKASNKVGTGDDTPAVFVSWKDANNYVRWLSSKTAATYRLPSEAEWEYAAANGIVGAHPAPTQRSDNATQEPEYLREWVQDCWHPSYKGAPTDGSARIDDPDCPQRVRRGGAQQNAVCGVRCAARYFNDHGTRVGYIGFRVVKVLKRCQIPAVWERLSE